MFMAESEVYWGTLYNENFCYCVKLTVQIGALTNDVGTY